MKADFFRTTRFHKCTNKASELEHAKAEVAFAGRSNAGKSTLVNAICYNNKIAKTSVTPGKTRTINVYSVKVGKWVVDLPGYGYAKVSKTEKYSWDEMAEEYLTSRASLRAIFVIIDAHVGPTPLDLQMLNWLKHEKYPYRLIVNKIDKISKLRLTEQQEKLSDELRIKKEHIFWISGRSNIGTDDVRECIIELLEL